MAKLFIPFIKRSVSPQFLTIFGKLNFWRKFDRRGPYKNSNNLALYQIVLEKYFLAKLFVPVISRSVSPQFEAILVKLNFWQKFDRRGPYKNSENLEPSQKVLYFFFCLIICSCHLEKCFSTILDNFWKIEFFTEIRQVQTLQKKWKFSTISKSARKNFWQNYLFLSSREVFLQNFRQFFEN